MWTKICGGASCIICSFGIGKYYCQDSKNVMDINNSQLANLFRCLIQLYSQLVRKTIAWDIYWGSSLGHSTWSQSLQTLARPWQRAQGCKVKLIVQDHELMTDLFLLLLKNYEAVLGIECDCDLWEIFINWNFSTIDYVIYAEQYRDDSQGKAR